MATLPWIAAVGGPSLLALVLLGWIWLVRRGTRAQPLPTEWTLSARPVFSADERRVYKLMREALPHHVVLSKLPLVRFCQPNDPGEVRFWYELLGSINVTFAVCSANGRVLAAIDLDTDRNNSRRTLQIKQSVLGACRVRYLRCPVDNLPSVAELQLLVPAGASVSRTPHASSNGLDEARDSLANTVAHRRAQRTALWQDSSLFQDSFFAPDNRLDGFGVSEYGTLPIGPVPAPLPSPPRSSNGSGADSRYGHLSQAPRDRSNDDVAGVVVESPGSSLSSLSRH